MSGKKTNKYYETILDWFRQQLNSGALKEGDVIPSERELASRFGVSRVPVREAFRILEYIGIISNEPDGMTVKAVNMQQMNLKADFARDVTMETLENLFEVRIILERRPPTMPRSAAQTKISKRCGQLLPACRHC